MDRRWPRALSALTFIALIGACTNTRRDVAADVPAALRPPATQVRSSELRASGVQIYECTPAKDNPQRFEWTFRAPEAELFSRAGRRVGKHYAGPTWEANDGSKVVGEVVARDPGPDPAAIPWLLLRAKSVSGQGVFAQTQSVQRLRTTGGKAPAGGCDQAHGGQQLRVPYTAVYAFFK